MTCDGLTSCPACGLDLAIDEEAQQLKWDYQPRPVQMPGQMEMEP